MDTNYKLNNIKNKIDNTPIKIMIIGLGGVGNYLYDYIMQWDYQNIEIHICGRNIENMQTNINIVKVANTIKYNKFKPVYMHQIDLENVDTIKTAIEEIQPDFIVNSSRAYSGLKYGTLSWHNIRAYGLWAPLAIKFIRNIMTAYELSGSKAIVINTSYSDVVNCWLKSAGIPNPDFGSGNLNHLIPRIKFAVLKLLNMDVADINKIQIKLVTSHFHDVLISKEGIVDGVYPLLDIKIDSKPVKLSEDIIYANCNISMPVDSKRNMMNASSNFEIIRKIIETMLHRNSDIFHSPGAFGLIGGYPVMIDATGDDMIVDIDCSIWNKDEMILANRKSIYLDGIEDVMDGNLIWTDEIINKVKNSFNCDIPKKVSFHEIDTISDMIIDNIIKPNVR